MFKIANVKCYECGGPTVDNSDTQIREPKYLCGNPQCHMCDRRAEKVFLVVAVCKAAHEWSHVADDTTRGEDETALGEAEEALARAVNALTTRFPDVVHDDAPGSGPTVGPRAEGT